MKRIGKLNSSHECAMNKGQQKIWGNEKRNRKQQKQKKSKQIMRNCCKRECAHKGRDNVRTDFFSIQITGRENWF